jgi:hypothetical protein
MTHAVTEQSSNLLLPNGCLENYGRDLDPSRSSHMQRRASPILDTQGVELRVGIRADRPVYIFRHQRSNTEPGYAAAAGGHVRAWRQKDGREPHHVVITGTASSRQQSNAMQSGKAIKLKTWADRWMRRGRSGKRVNPIMSR